MTLYDYEIRDIDAWEGAGTPLRVSLDVVETLGTGSHEPTVSLSAIGLERLSFAAHGVGDGVEDASVAFVADLADANAALSALTLHATASSDVVRASGHFVVGACDSGERTTGGGGGGEGQAEWWDWREGCREGGWAQQNTTFGLRMGTMPILDSVWPAAAPVGGGLTVEVCNVAMTQENTFNIASQIRKSRVARVARLTLHYCARQGVLLRSARTDVEVTSGTSVSLAGGKSLQSSHICAIDVLTR